MTKYSVFSRTNRMKIKKWKTLKGKKVNKKAIYNKHNKNIPKKSIKKIYNKYKREEN